MKVLHWYPNFLGGGGVANAVLGLAQAQAECGAEVTIAAARPDGLPLYQKMNVSVAVRVLQWDPKYTLRFGPLVLRGIPASLQKEIRAFSPDVVHVHGEFNLDNFWILQLLPSSPIVLSPHGAFHPVVLKKSKRVFKKLYIALSKRFFYKKVGFFHALSPAEAKHIRALLGAKPVYTIPQGISPFATPAFVASDLHPRGNYQVRFVFVGRLDVYTKGLDILIKAFGKAVRSLQNQDLNLTLIGPSWEGSLEQLRKWVNELHLQSRIRFTGVLPGEQVAGFLKESDIYIHPSRHEGFPLAIVEALLAGKPAILSREIGTVTYPEIASLPYVKIVPPEVVSVAQAIEEVSAQLEALQKAAFLHAQHIREFFDWHRIAKRHLEYYERLVSSYL